MTRPSRPSVAKNAKASGTPAKLEATPENVSVEARTHSGKPPRTMATARANPARAPSTAEAMLTLQRNHVGADDGRLGQRLDIFKGETALPEFWNAPTMSRKVGRIRNIRAKMKNGATPSQLHGKRKRCGARLVLCPLVCHDVA